MIPLLSPIPDPDQPDTFAADADSCLNNLNTVVAAINQATQAMNFNAVSATSTTSNSIGTGSKTFVIEENKSFLGGMPIILADAAAPSTNLMMGIVTGYNPTTGSLNVNIKRVSGSGTKTNWIISQTIWIENEAYPVGSIYINGSSSANPASLLGYGTWAVFGTGRTLVAINPANPIMDTVGEVFGQENTVLPSHSHTDSGHNHGSLNGNQFLTAGGGSGGTIGGSGVSVSGATTASSSANISTAGVSPTNGNYQPSITVYMWIRTA